MKSEATFNLKTWYTTVNRLKQGLVSMIRNESLNLKISFEILVPRWIYGLFHCGGKNCGICGMIKLFHAGMVSLVLSSFP